MSMMPPRRLSSTYTLNMKTKRRPCMLAGVRPGCIQECDVFRARGKAYSDLGSGPTSSMPPRRSPGTYTLNMKMRVRQKTMTMCM